MTLHEQIEAAIKDRLAVAQAAQPGPWMTGETAPHLVDAVVYGQSTSWPGHITQACNVEYADGGMANARAIAANGPDRIIRDCQRDLKVLARHGPARRLGGVHEICAHDWADSDGWLSMWPCAEIADLAESYGITPTEGTP